MRYLIVLLVFSLNSQFAWSQENLKQLFWLSGTWERLNEKPDLTTYETWKIISDEKLEGIGVTIKGTDTVFVEELAIEIQNENIYYIANVSHNQQPVKFLLTNLTDTGFLSENKQHDFPKFINYELKKNTLNASIGDQSKEIVFTFSKKENTN